MKLFSIFLINVFLLSSLACQASNSDQAFSDFWSSFRDAALKGDYESLGKKIKFPLEVRGVDDSTPAGYYPKDKIAEIFPKLLDQVVYGYEQEELQEYKKRDLIQKKPAIATTVKSDFHRIDQFEFEKVNGNWFLVRAYLE